MRACVDKYYFFRDRVLYCDENSKFLVDVLLPTLFFLSLHILIDSGACFTCVSAKFVKQHKLPMIPLDVGPLYSACGRALNVKGTVKLVLFFGNKNVLLVSAYVLDNLQEDVIVGRDILARYDLFVHVSDKSGGESKQNKGMCKVCSSNDGAPSGARTPFQKKKVILCEGPKDLAHKCGDSVECRCASATPNPNCFHFVPVTPSAGSKEGGCVWCVVH